MTTNPTHLTRHYLISGRVQGVGFRAFTLHTAQRLNLTGWVRNLTDGRVEALACGPEARLLEFETEVNRGPSHSRVEQVQVHEVASLPMAEPFAIQKDGRQPWSDC